MKLPLVILQYWCLRSAAFAVPPKRPKTILQMKTSNDHPLANSRISRFRFSVLDVDKTLAFWENRGGRTHFSRGSDGAIMDLGIENAYGISTALELERFDSPEEFELGNDVSYMEACVETPQKVDEKATDPNGITVRWSSPLAGNTSFKLCLKTSDLEATRIFYTQKMGMEVVEEKKDNLCLAYESQEKNVPDTILAFELVDTTRIEFGTCFTGLEIQTSNWESAYSFLEDADVPLQLILDLDLDLCEVIDPNGYPIVLACEYW